MDDVARSVLEQINKFDYYSLLSSKFTNNLPHNHKEKIIGFQINGIGYEHIQQSKILYDILIKHYKIPLVLIYGNNSTNGVIYQSSEVCFQPYISNETRVKKGDILSISADLISVKPTSEYERSHQINYWINFLVGDLLNFRTMQLVFANQISINNLMYSAPLYIIGHLGNTRLVSITKQSMITPYNVPPLIETNGLESAPEPYNIVCYSNYGEKFPRILQKIAKQNPHYIFHHFHNYNHHFYMPTNVIKHECSKSTFKNHQKKACAVLCTSENELIQECVFMGIPVATMASSISHKEQMENFEYYITNGWCTALKDDLNIRKLIKKDVSRQQNEIQQLINGREERILKLLET